MTRFLLHILVAFPLSFPQPICADIDDVVARSCKTPALLARNFISIRLLYLLGPYLPLTSLQRYALTPKRQRTGGIC